MKFLRGLLVVVGIFCFAQGAEADQRLFAYSYQAHVIPKGGFEFEQWVTGRFGKEAGDYARWDLRSELEYGVTDRLTSALYLNFKSVYSAGVPSDGTLEESKNKFEFGGVSSEWKYQLLDPEEKWLGLLLYGEVTYSGEELKLEQKLVLEKIVNDRVTLVTNIVAEEEWEFEGDHSEKKFEFEWTSGISYKLKEGLSIGLELLNKREFPDYGSQESSAWFLGPNIHYSHGEWWMTLAVLPQIHGSPHTEDGLELEDHERLQVRLVSGIYF